MSMRTSRLKQIVNEEVQLFLERTQQLNEQGLKQSMRAQIWKLNAKKNRPGHRRSPR